MPISTSVITGTKAHKHTAESSDGSFLDANSVTGFSNLTEGGIIQGNNGNQATNLTLGNAAEILHVNAGATALEYTPPTIYNDRLEQLAAFQTVNATTDTIALTFSQIDLTDYQNLWLTFSGVLVGASDIEVTMGNGSSYRYIYEQADSGVWSNVNATGQTEWKLTDLGSGTWFIGHCFLYGMFQNEGVSQYAAQWQVTGMSTSNTIGGGFTSGGSHDITSVTIQTSTSYFQQYCRFNLMGLRSS